MSFRLRTVLFSMAVLSLHVTGYGQFVLHSGAASEVVTPQVRAQLLAHAPQGVPMGAGADKASAPNGTQPVWVGLQLTHTPHWHTYWKNSGDSGEPTRLDWTLPPGVLAGDIAWPLAKKIPIGPLANYGYEGTVLLPVPLTITPDFVPPASGVLEVALKASWLVCKEACIPQEGQFSLRLPLQGSTAVDGAQFEAALAAQPRTAQGAHSAAVLGDGRTLTLHMAGLPAEVQGKTLELLPETAQVLRNGAVAGRDWQQHWEPSPQGAVWVARLPVSDERTQSPTRFAWVVADTARGQGWRAEAAVQGVWPAVAAPVGVSPALQAALNANATGAGGADTATPSGQAATTAPLALALALLGAFIGGMILNLMPCVFPVLAVKLLGFAQHGSQRQAQRQAGWAYTGGVVASFLVLGALLLVLRAAGQQLGWGFQLQSPAFVAALALLFTVIGLNLAGLFEMGTLLPSRLAALRVRHPAADAALSGVLAVAVASPCTAPFMGASLGLAVTLPAAAGLAVFGAMGLGMALPYWAASRWPALARRLPRPGAWMDTLRRLLAFPMFATVIWLVWVLGQQAGIDGVAALLALLLTAALLLWALTLRGRTRAVIAIFSIAIFILLTCRSGLLDAVEPTLPEPAASHEAASQTLGAVAAGATAAATHVPDAAIAAAPRWQAWSAQRQQAALAQGQPVLVDYTAAWCVTCQYNKKTTLASAEVLAALDARNVLLLRADWTRRDAAITAALAALGRNGVPTYALHAPGQPVQLLPELLTSGAVLQALTALKR